MIILDKLLKDLQAKIPLLKKKSKADDEDENSDDLTDAGESDGTSTISADETDAGEGEDKSMLMKLRDRILKRKDVEEDKTSVGDDIVDEDGNKLKKPAGDDKKKKMIRIAIVVCLIIAIGQEFLPSDEVPTAAPEMTDVEKKVAARKAANKKKKEAEELAAANTGGGATVPETIPTTPETSGTTTPTEPVATTDTSGGTTAGTETMTPVETTTTSGGSTITPETSPVTVNETQTTGSENVNPPVTDPTAGMTTTGGDTSGETSPVVTETSGGESSGVTDTSVTNPDPTMGLGTTGNPSTTSPDQIDSGMAGGDTDMTEQMLKELEKQTKTPKAKAQVTEYASPPDYEFKGRGLVYNCVGKHWACVDGPSYRRCEDNSSSLKFLNKKSECYPFNVYDSQKGCESMQNRMVSSSAKTEFCNDL